MSDRELLSIGQVAAATGLQTSALRYYEKQGLIDSAVRIGGRRHFGPSVLPRLAAIALLQDAGFTIAEIGELVGTGHGGGWRTLAQKKLREIDAHIERIEGARDLLESALECECSTLETCDLVRGRRGRHGRVARTVTLSFSPQKKD